MDVPDYALKVDTEKKKNEEYTQVPAVDTIVSYQDEEQTQVKLPTGGVCTLIGGFLVCLSFGSDFSYPNINTYLTSYMRENGYNENLRYRDFVFLTTTKMVLQGAAMPWLGGLARKMGPKIAVATGSAIYSGGYLLTYLTVQHHFSLAILSLSLHGIAFCFVYATTIRTAQAWFSPARKGLVASIVVSGYGFGSSLWAPIQTGFVNPDNLKAAVANCSETGTGNCTDTGKDKYFTDPEVLDRVPLMFLVLGIIYAVMGFIAVLLIAEPEPSKERKEQIQTPDKEEQKEDVNEEKENNLSPLQVLKTSWFYQVRNL